MSNAATSPRSDYRIHRWALAGLCGCGVLYTLATWLQTSHEATAFAHSPNVASLIYTDPIKSAITQKMDSAKSVLQASFLVFAVLWGVILAKKGEGKLVLGNRPEIAMFFCANACFLFSWTFFANYSDAMAAIQARADTSLNPDDPKEQTIPDFRTKVIDALPERQYSIFVLALMTTGVTLLSAHLLKEASSCPSPEASPASS